MLILKCGIVLDHNTENVAKRFFKSDGYFIPITNACVLS